MEKVHPLRAYRKDNDLTQEALAARLGVTPMTIWRWENRRRRPRIKELPRITEVTGIAPGALLELESTAE